jgi:hypothetical protein
MKEEVTCCVCGDLTDNEPDWNGDIYCSVRCARMDGVRIECPECGYPECRCDEEDWVDEPHRRRFPPGV